jgi:hypothetical protein
MAAKVSYEKKNLNRLAGEFLVASRLTQRSYMITLQWGNTTSYDILVFDKKGKRCLFGSQIVGLVHKAMGAPKEVCKPRNRPDPVGKAICVLRRFSCP